MGCEQGVADPTLYVLVTKEYFCFLVVYVDDIFLLSDCENSFDDVTS